MLQEVVLVDAQRVEKITAPLQPPSASASGTQTREAR
jgi:hypothetical protein